MRPRLLDLYCGAGGAAMGYHRAGWEVVGVDHRPQPRYPFTFYQADALEFLELAAYVGNLERFSAIHASPPCQAYSATLGIWSNKRDHPDLLGPTREALQRTGLPWIIENVEGAPMRVDVRLCGSSFGLESPPWQLRRHRWFELEGFWCLSPPCDHHGRVLGVYGNGGADPVDRQPSPHGAKANMAMARRLMGIDWMRTAEITQAIPPAYTEYLGRELLAALQLTQSPPIE